MTRASTPSFFLRVRLGSLVGLAASLVLGACTTGGTSPVPPRTLTVVTANIANAFELPGGITWQVKMDRLANQIVATGAVPDIISITESSGWTNCSTPASDNTGDYDMVDRLVWQLRTLLGVTYRVAYLTGAQGELGAGRCHYYSGDTLLYNPNRIINLTPGDVASRPQAAHNENLLGFMVRRSLPICSRGAQTNIPNLAQLIDGPSQFDKCNVATPAAPAWAWQVQHPGGGIGLIATLARFGLVDVQGATFDVVTTHPKTQAEHVQFAEIDNFIDALIKPPYRNTRPYYPVIILGDFNCLVGLPPYDETGTGGMEVRSAHATTAFDALARRDDPGVLFAEGRDGCSVGQWRRSASAAAQFDRAIRHDAAEPPALSQWAGSRKPIVLRPLRPARAFY